ncbi:hypothetical protein C5E45_22950 [Nocardia nova]|uniref:Uncharacterized protein n=1 Tax=Nocardia nova TaxID=37330 RepID=A0A2S6AL58_9NOCA|nr:hypothetical protein C5E41_07490 [Nocardia nova]PPJ35960.1 hypothetical protein C5E45_22950 [Nocardia nova]
MNSESRALLDVLSDRIPGEQLESCRSSSDAGEYAELVDEIAAILVKREISVTPVDLWGPASSRWAACPGGFGWRGALFAQVLFDFGQGSGLEWPAWSLLRDITEYHSFGSYIRIAADEPRAEHELPRRVESLRTGARDVVWRSVS